MWVNRNSEVGYSDGIRESQCAVKKGEMAHTQRWADTKLWLPSDSLISPRSITALSHWAWSSAHVAGIFKTMTVYPNHVNQWNTVRQSDKHTCVSVKSLSGRVAQRSLSTRSLCIPIASSKSAQAMDSAPLMMQLLLGAKMGSTAIAVGSVCK